MDHKEENSAPTDHSFQLILVDDSLIQRTLSHLPDLYLQLVKEPSFVKKQSCKYDYRPAPQPFNDHEDHLVQLSQPENFSQKANANRGIRCSCCKTKCQKNYCECFKAGIACGSECSCTECSNDEISIIDLPKRNSGSGCKCLKSHCLKNYCQCHSGGRKCNQECRCSECHNMGDKETSEQQELLGLSKPKKKVKKSRVANLDSVGSKEMALGG